MTAQPIAVPEPTSTPEAGRIECVERGISYFRNRFVDLRVDRVQFPGGRQGIYNVIGRSGDEMAAMTIVRAELDGEHWFGLTRQFRYPPNRFSVEFPGGGVREHCAIEASREVIEELGVVPLRIDRLGEMQEMAALWVASTSVWLAEIELDAIPAPHVDEENGAVSLWATADEIVAMILDGSMSDSASIAGWTFYTAHLAGLATPTALDLVAG